MNTELFISKRIFFDKENRSQYFGTIAIVKIATIAIALGLIVMILSVAIVTGFKTEIRNKVIGFGSHITITNYDNNSSYETIPIINSQTIYSDLKSTDGIKHIQIYAIKAGIIKTKSEIQGVVLKGIGSDYDWSFFKKNIVEGNPFIVNDSVKSNEVVISKYLASLLKLKIGDNLFMYFIQNNLLMRKFKIVGLYNTGFEENDKMIVLADIAQIQKLNDWSDDKISGYEIIINDYEKLEQMTNLVQDKVGYQFTEDGARLKINSIKDNYPQIFDWLNLSDTNVWIILVLMLFVAVCNMIAGLLIIILERTNMIGILKAFGTGNWSIQKIFLINASFIISKGLFWGNIIGIAFCLLQYYTGIIKLDATSYYVSEVPINLKLLHLFLLNIGTMLVTIAVLVIPSFIISKISPIKAIKFN